MIFNVIEETDDNELIFFINADLSYIFQRCACYLKLKKKHLI